MTGGKPPIAVDRLVRSTELTCTETYRLLADDYTRATLAILLERESATVEGLAEVITDRLDPASRADTDASVRLALVHVVLPKLAAHDLLTYDRNEGVVSATIPDVNAGATAESLASTGRP